MHEAKVEKYPLDGARGPVHSGNLGTRIDRIMKHVTRNERVRQQIFNKAVVPQQHDRDAADVDVTLVDDLPSSGVSHVYPQRGRVGTVAQATLERCDWAMMQHDGDTPCQSFPQKDLF